MLANDVLKNIIPSDEGWEGLVTHKFGEGFSVVVSFETNFSLALI